MPNMHKTGPRQTPFPTAFRVAAFVMLLSSMLFSGCASAPVYEQAKDAYMEALHDWTGHAKVTEEYSARLYMTATYKTMEFRRAYVERYAASYGLDDYAKAAMLKKEEDEAGLYNEFFFIAFTPESRWNEFGLRNPVWRLYLEDPAGARAIPLAIERLDEGNPLLREFFPYLDEWSRAYAVRFPKYSEDGTKEIPSPEASFLKLRVTGVLGTGEIQWRIKEGD
jgi:hypothetical protein